MRKKGNYLMLESKKRRSMKGKKSGMYDPKINISKVSYKNIRIGDLKTHDEF